MVICPDFCLVVVEGCLKSIKRYNKLMLRRIDWEDEVVSQGDEQLLEDPDMAPNKCHLVWQVGGNGVGVGLQFFYF